MTTKGLRRLRTVRTGELQKRITQFLGETGVLSDGQPMEELLVQVEKLLSENNRLSARFAAVSDVAVAVNSSLRPEEIVGVIVKKARDGLDFGYCSLGLLTGSSDEFVLRPLVWPEGPIPSPGMQTLPSTGGLPGVVLASGKPIMVQNLAERPLKVRPVRFVGLPNPELEGKITQAGVRSLLVLPLNAGGRMLGVLMFGACDPNAYTQDDLQIAYLFSMMVAAALHNSQLYDAEVRRAHQLQMLSEIGQTANALLDTRLLIARIPPLVRDHFGFDVAKIGILEGDEVVYAQEAQYIAGHSHPLEMRLPLLKNGKPAGIVGQAASTGETILVNDVFEDERSGDVLDSLSGPHIRSVLIIPLSARDKVLGLLHFESFRVHTFNKADISLLQSMANQLAVALDNARLYQQVNELFHGYIAPQVASTLLDDPSNAQLGGQRREITVLFADLDGFTSLSEQVPPEELLELLNAALGVASEAILEYGGTIDKYMGDAVMALFNAPQDQPDHAWRAVKAAISMQRKLRHLSGSWKHKLFFSVGVNSGEAVVGNIGTSSLRNFTAIGDTVNLAKRIEETAGPGQVLVSQPTYELAMSSANGRPEGNGDGIFAYRVGTRQIKGRSQPAVLYEVYPYPTPGTLPVAPVASAAAVAQAARTPGRD